MFKKRHITLLFLTFLLKGLWSQNITPIAVSNYGTAQSQFISPSLNGYSPYNWHVNLAGAWVNGNNNFLSLHMPYSLYRAPNSIPEQYQTENGNASFEDEWIWESINGKQKCVDVAATIYGPSASVKVKNFRVGLISRGFAAGRLSGVSENLAHAIYKEMDSAKGAFIYFNEFGTGLSNEGDKITMAAHSSAAVGLNLSYALPLKHNRQFIGGISMKRNFGYQGAYFSSEKMILNSNKIDSVFFEPTSIQIMQFGENETAKGWGYDIGATYIFHKKEFKRNGPYQLNNTRYFSKLSVGLIDIGSVKYKDAYVANLSINNTLGFNTDSFDLDISQDNYPSVLDSVLGIHGTYTDGRQSIRVGLPTRLVVSYDRQFRKHFFMSATLSQSLRKRHSRHMRYQSTLMLAPRWEWSYVEVSAPVELGYDYRALRLGLSMRAGPLYLGTNSLLPFLYTRGFRDVDFFIGIAFGNLSDYGLLKSLEDRKERKAAKKRAKGCPEF